MTEKEKAREQGAGLAPKRALDHAPGSQQPGSNWIDQLTEVLQGLNGLALADDQYYSSRRIRVQDLTGSDIQDILAKYNYPARIVLPCC